MQKSYHVGGMSCQGCVQSVSNAVSKRVPGSTVSVDLATGTVRVEGAADDAAVRQAIEEAGFDFQGNAG